MVKKDSETHCSSTIPAKWITGLVSTETAVPRQWGVEANVNGFINRGDKVIWPL